jgi:glycerophosphoryl diester phosphodiesterase
MKISVKYLVTLLFLFIFFSQDIWAETEPRTYSIKRKYSLTHFGQEHGIRVSTDKPWNRVTVAVVTEQDVNFHQAACKHSGPLPLYQAYVDENSEELSHKGFTTGTAYTLTWLKIMGCHDHPNTDTSRFITKNAFTAAYWLGNGAFRKAIKNINVIITITLDGDLTLADVKEIKVPGIDKPIASWEFEAEEVMKELRDILEDPKKYPNYVMLAAHRGYWMYAPENSLEAFKNGIDFGADMVEIDIKMTADKQIMVAHDFHLGRLTTLPDKLKNAVFEDKDPNGDIKDKGYYKFSKMRLCDLRPDLCPGNRGYDPKNPNNCDTCTATEGINNQRPVRLRRPNGQQAENLPTLAEAFDFFLKNKPVLIDIDKIDPGAGTTEEPKTYFFDALYALADRKGILKRIIVKQRIDKFNPSELKKSEVVDWNAWYFTPTAFADVNLNPKNPEGIPTGVFDWCNDGRGTNTLIGCLREYKRQEINSPGIEYIYMYDPAESSFAETYEYIRETMNNRVFQFPAYPENTVGVWNPKPLIFTDIDPSLDRRNDWNWLLQPERRPDVIISDRFEVLFDLLKDMGLRSKQ